MRRSMMDAAMRLSHYFGTGAEVWLRLQARYDPEVAEARRAKGVNGEVKGFARNSA